MKIDVYDSSGKKTGTRDLPAELFEATINEGLMHLMLVMQRNNRRIAVAHAKTRGEVKASTRKLYRQKGTGRARRGSAGANILRGGAKAFGPRNVRNFRKAMPKKMRREALRSCLSYSAGEGRIISLESYAGKPATKEFVGLVEKLPVEMGRKIVFVMPEKMDNLELGARNVPGVKTIPVSYLNPEDVLSARHMVFIGNAIDVAFDLFSERKKLS